MWLLICTSAFCILAVLVWLIPRSQDFHSAIEGKTVLLVTAHPDDECMFFAPTLLSIAATSNTKVVLLCLSIGHFVYSLHTLYSKLRCAFCVLVLFVVC